MIPQVKTWIVTVKSTGNKIEVLAPTRFLARLNFQFDYVQYWGEDITIGLKRKC